MISITIFILVWISCCYLGNHKIKNVQIDQKANLQFRGIMSSMIVCHHLYILFPDKFYWLKDCGVWGGSLCSVFFYLSGYGLFVSYQNKGIDYLRNFFVRHLWKLILPMSVVSVVNVILFGQWNLPHLWFIYVLVLYYFIFWICFLFSKTDVCAICLIWISIPLFALVAKSFEWNNRWYISLPGFALGLTIAKYQNLYKDFLLIVEQKHLKNLVLLGLLIPPLYYFYNIYIHPMPFAGLLFISSAPVLFITLNYFYSMPSNKWLQWLGSISYEIYLLHVGILMFLSNYISSATALIVYTIVATIVSSCVLNFVVKWLNSHFFFLLIKRNF